MFSQKNLSREGGVELVVKELCTRLVEEDVMSHAVTKKSKNKECDIAYTDASISTIRQVFVPTVEKKGLAAVTSSAFAAFIQL